MTDIVQYVKLQRHAP